MDRRKFLSATGGLTGAFMGLRNLNKRTSATVTFDNIETNKLDPVDVNSSNIIVNFSNLTISTRNIVQIGEPLRLDIEIYTDTDELGYTTLDSYLIELSSSSESVFLDSLSFNIADNSTDRNYKDAQYASVRLKINHPDVTTTSRSFPIIEENIEISNVFSSDLVGWWKLDRKDATVIDSTNQNSNGSTVNNIVGGFAGRGGLQSFQFNGSDYVDMGSPIIPTGQKTVSIWFKYNSLDNGDAYLVADANNNDYLFYYNDDNSLGFINRSEGSTFEAPTTIDRNTWVHYCYTYDGDIERLYKDGELLDGENGSDTTSSANTYLGRTDKPGYFNGNMCDFRVYNRGLSKDEVKTVYKQGAIDRVNPPDESSSGVVNWRLNEDPTTTSIVNDSWGSNDGAVSGSVQNLSNAIRNSGVYFQGVNDQAIRTDSNVGIQNQATMSAWINVRGKGDNSYNRYVTYDAANVENYGENGILIYWDADGLEWGFRININGSGTKVTENQDIPRNDWIHVLGTWDGEVIKLYLNGNEYQSKQLSGNFDDSNCRLSVGNRSDIATDHVDAFIDDVRLYDVALSASQVRKVYRYGTRGINLRGL